MEDPYRVCGRKRLASVLLIIAIFSATLSPAFAAEPSGVAGPAQPRTRFEEERLAVGKTNGVTYDLGPIAPVEPEPNPSGAAPAPGDRSLGVDDTTGLVATLKAMLFGRDRSILDTKASVNGLLEGETDFYWGGFKVWNSKPDWKDGAFVVAAGFPTVTMRAPLVVIPVGPVSLRVDAGVVAEANLFAKLTPLLSIPVQFTSIRGEFGPEVSAAGFIEGYAKFVAIRAGVGGELELVRSNARITGTVGFGGYSPNFEFDGFVSLLAGKIYGFVDYFNLFRWQWKRALKPTFADWPGKCFDFSKHEASEASACAAVSP